MSGAKNGSLDTPTNAPPALDEPGILPGEKRWIGGLLLALLGLRVWAAWKIQFTSDESQHLHVVWAWANHGPQGRRTGTCARGGCRSYRGKVLLDAGRHDFVSDDPSKPLGIVWSRAVERGFQPSFSFNPATADSKTHAP